MNLRGFSFILVLTLLTSCVPYAIHHPSESMTSLRETPGVRGGVVATSEAAATQVGSDILQHGGNAIDAAASVAFALNVVEPQSSGIGGGGFMMIYLAQTGETIIVDSRETAPAAADPNMFLDRDGSPVPFDLRSTSGIAVGVPGMIRGIALALENWGTMSFAAVLAPATQMAAEGIRVGRYLEQQIKDGINGGRLANEIGQPPYDLAREVFAPGSVPLKRNELLIQPDLAKTFHLLARQGPDAFYTGDIAQAIVSTQRHGRTAGDYLNKEGLQGRMSLDDLASYQAVVREPVEGSYRGYRIVSAPPPSSGGLTVLQVLKLIEQFPIGNQIQGYGFGSTRTLHVMLESMRVAFADRAVWMGDADFVVVPSQGLLDQDYLALRSPLITSDLRHHHVTAGNPLPFDNSFGQQSVKLREPVSNNKEGMNTTHFTIIDRQGNIVSYTNSIESTWGTGLMVPGFGFFLNNELTDFNAVPAFNADAANFNPGANDVAPKKRPRSSMAPTLVFHHGKPVAAYGSPGGSTIINSVVNITLNLIDHQFTIQEAVDAPRMSQTHANGSPTYEAGFSENVVRELKNLGHDLQDEHVQVIGSVQAVIINENTKLASGAADGRRDGSAIFLEEDML